MNTWIKQKKGQVSFMMRVGLGKNGAHFLSFLSLYSFIAACVYLFEVIFVKSFKSCPHSCASTMNSAGGDWPTARTVFLSPMVFPNCRMQIACTISLLWLTWALSPTYHIQSKHCTIGQWTLFWTDMGRA